MEAAHLATKDIKYLARLVLQLNKKTHIAKK
jgi:hypothetical protein